MLLADLGEDACDDLALAEIGRGCRIEADLVGRRILDAGATERDGQRIDLFAGGVSERFST